ncbi:MAG: hypothetical protein ACM37W_22910 [Actinomycetota bacterium]
MSKAWKLEAEAVDAGMTIFFSFGVVERRDEFDRKQDAHTIHQPIFFEVTHLSYDQSYRSIYLYFNESLSSTPQFVVMQLKTFFRRK